MPSAIFFNAETGGWEYGKAAVAAYVDGVEGRLLRALKSTLGSSLINESTRMGNKKRTFVEILGLLISHVKARAEEEAGHALDSVVVGRPVRFNDRDDEADRNAEDKLLSLLRASGFKYVETQFEPVAAAMNYEAQIDAEKLVMVMDLGGGTSDFVVARLSPDRAAVADRSSDILGRSGVHVGGTDFDRAFSLARVMPELGRNSTYGPKQLATPNRLYADLATWHRIPFLYTRKTETLLNQIAPLANDPVQFGYLSEIIKHRRGHLLAGNVEAAKIDLSSNDLARIELPVSARTQIDVDQSDFVHVVMGLVEKLEIAVDECLASATVTSDQIDAVFLTGGTASIPVVRNRLRRKFPKAETVAGDTFGSVGLGLALDAYRRFGRPST